VAPHETREHAVRRAEARRLALREIDRQLADNKRHLADLATHLASQLLAKHSWARSPPDPGSRWNASDPADERKLIRRIEAHGITTTVRATRGCEIRACGQIAAT
jgi:adenine C2-methylase RlmN of 23S rRNA A2503 and tRNA A37